MKAIIVDDTKVGLRTFMLASIAASMASIHLGGTHLHEPRYGPNRAEDSPDLKSANAKINKVRQERRMRLLKEREIRSLNCRERRELERNIYAEY